MKVTTENKPQVKPIITFPNIGITGKGVIVLFHNYGRGIVLAIGHSQYGVGDYSTCWDMLQFALYPHPVTIQSEEAEFTSQTRNTRR